MLLLSTSQVKILQTTEEFFRNYGRKSRRLYLYIICASIWKGKKSIQMSTLIESNNQQQISHCYQRIDLPVKKGPLLIYGYNSDLLYFFRQYKPMLLYVAKQPRYSIGQYTPTLLRYPRPMPVHFLHLLFYL